MRLTDRALNTAALISQVISAVAVLITLIYLTIQIRDNTKELQNQSHYNALEIANSPIADLINNPELASIDEIGFINPDSLSEVNKLRFFNHMLLFFNAWEYLYYSNESESIPGSLWIGADAYYSNLVMTKPGLFDFWQEYRHSYAEPFHSHVAVVFDKVPSNIR